MKILIMEDEKLLKPPLPEALVILDVTAPGITAARWQKRSRPVSIPFCTDRRKRRRLPSFGNTSWSFPQECCAAV